MKTCYLFLVIAIVSTPGKTEASLLSDLINITSPQTSAEEGPAITDDFGTDDFSFNSQNVPLLEASSIDPDIKNNENIGDFMIVDNQALVYEGGLIGSGLESVSSGGGILTYEVKEGDTLSQIAEDYNVSQNTIRWENGITGNNIKIGQKLNILPVTGVKHIVKKGDTLQKIATKYDAELDDIKIFNEIDEKGILKEGDVLIIPNGVIDSTTVAPKSSSSSSSQSGSSSSSSKVTSGYYIRPTTGRITSPYGPRKGSYHYGIDIGNSRGTTVVAAASGVVIKTVTSCVEGKTSCGGRYGNYIVIEHPNGQTTTYAHLSKVSVSVGQKVSQGKKIGAIGNTGRSTGPHLHFEIQKSNGSTLKPPF